MKLLLLVSLIGVSLSSTTQQPSPRFLQEMAYDKTNKQILMYGGAGNNDSIFYDLWCYKEGKWNTLASSGPTSSFKCAFAFDSDRQKAILFGGVGVKTMSDETWEWDGSKWKHINVVGPSARIHCMASYDKKHKKIVLFGGIDSSGLLCDTWIYNGEEWIKKNTNGPKNCLPHGIFYDDAKESVILLTMITGAALQDPLHSQNELWSWTGSVWERIPQGDILTSLNSLQALAGSNKGEILLFDGDDKSKTWIFSNEHWVNPISGSPSSRIGHSIVFDESKNKFYLFGGSNRKEFFNDFWEWQGKQWNVAQR